MKTTLIVVASFVAGPALAAEPTGDAARGKALYLANHCYSCHGTTGAGGGAAGPKIAPPIPLAVFANQLRHPADRMPPYTDKVLTDTQVADIRAYLASLPAGKTAAQIPMLNR